MPAFQDPEIYREILDTLQIGVSVLDLQQKIVFWSEGAERITGYSRMDVLGHSCIDSILLHCNQTSCEMCVEQCPIRAALYDGKPMEGNGFIHHRSGHRAPVRTWAIPLRDKHGSIMGIIQTFEDEFAVTGPDPNDESMRVGGCLDELTGLPNQAMMQSRLREALGTFAELRIPFGIVFLETYELPKFRARYGQEAGSCMLQALARTLRRTLWATDFVGRWSEERFLVILAGCHEHALHAVTERVTKMMASATITWWGQELSLAVAGGVAPAHEGDNVESILERAMLSLAADNPSRSATVTQAKSANASSPG
jgi:diguanylate cyclase (GGDEF)-like protein/PAS domain S-box-containing protein